MRRQPSTIWHSRTVTASWYRAGPTTTATKNGDEPRLERSASHQSASSASRREFNNGGRAADGDCCVARRYRRGDLSGPDILQQRDTVAARLDWHLQHDDHAARALDDDVLFSGQGESG